MKSKVIVITGASDGIGAAAARRLSADGHHVVIVGRSPRKTEAVARELGTDFHLADFTKLRVEEVRDLDGDRFARGSPADGTHRSDGRRHRLKGAFAVKRPGDGFARAMAWVLGSIGVAGAAALVWRLGVSTIAQQLAALGRVLPVVLFITAFKYPTQTAGWRLALAAGQRPPWWPSLRATIAGDAVGYLTIAGPVAGEPLRAAILRPHLDMSVGIAVGALERAMYALGGTVVIVAALLILAARSGEHGITLAMVAGVLAAVVGAARLFWKPRRRVAIDRPEPRAGWRKTFDDLWHRRRRALAAIAGLCLIEHLLLLTESWVMLHALGASPSLATVVVFEGMSKLVNTAGAIVPGRLGAMEAGNAAVTAVLHIGASTGLALALMRRVRALVWGVVGLGLWGMDVALSGRTTRADAYRGPDVEKTSRCRCAGIAPLTDRGRIR